MRRTRKWKDESVEIRERRGTKMRCNGRRGAAGLKEEAKCGNDDLTNREEMGEAK